uniref:Uncharacterized protein n=1 Tax=Bionectria ochroleuca TaxID=29856 RepID=A0A8H7NLD1_BIOOC
MASPPNPSSPAAMSPPGPSAPQISVKKRSSTFDINGPNKRRKASSTSNNLIHPLRQTSFPPEARSPFPRSPSVDSASHVSGSQVSGVTASGAPKRNEGARPRTQRVEVSRPHPAWWEGRRRLP